MGHVAGDRFGKPITNTTQDNASSGDIIGQQWKPAGNATGTATVYGGQFQPRFNDGVAGGTLEGLQVAPILKGTTGDLSGDVRGMSIELGDDGGSPTRTISGDATFIRFRNYISSGQVVSGDVVGVEYEAAELGEAWDAAIKLPDGAAGLSGTAAAIATALPANTSFIRVKIGATFGKIPVYQD